MLRPTIAIMVAILALASAAPSEARKAGDRPSTQDIAICLQGGESDTDPGSAIASCCITDDLGGVEKGCWICNWDWSDCVWDPASARQAQQVTPFNPAQVLDPGNWSNQGGVRQQFQGLRVRPGALAPTQ